MADLSKGCRAGSDGDCYAQDCPQIRDGEPRKTGRHCPLDRCRPGAWGGSGCIKHEGHEIGDDGLCIEGRPNG